ncbi:hypothetical protein ACLB1Q_23720 [Escherichia coli]
MRNCSNLSDAVKALEGLASMPCILISLIALSGPICRWGWRRLSSYVKRQNLPFDIHIMSMNNEWFIQQVLEIGVQQLLSL